MSEQNEGTGMTDSGQGAVDDRGTSQSEGRAILKSLRDQGFEASDEKLAVALGRPVEEVAAWTGDGGDEQVDDDVIMKARGIAKQRGLTIE